MDEKQTILIVEDDKINRKILRKILEQDYDLIEAENGEIAWNILKNDKMKIGGILTDIMMPVMGGYELIAKIRQASMDELPVIVMTGESDVETEQKALDAGAWDFVTKPFISSILRSRLRNAIARRQVSVYRKMQKMAAHDSLTGMHNRSRMYEKSKKIMKEHPDKTFVFLRADIDHFALYNSAFGEEEGDKLLCYVANLFKELGRRFPLCSHGRMSADIFCVFLPYSGKKEILKEVVDEIQKKLAEYRRNYLLEISVGVYIIDDPDISMEECYIRATMGAQKCKRQYGEHIGYYDEKAGKRAQEEIVITNEMETALLEKQFVVYLQPKVSLATNRVCGAEALVRWKHPQKGLISPGVFIPVFEKNGFIAKLDYYVWESTCQMLCAWMNAGQIPMPISVNISRISLYNPLLVDDLTELIQKYALPVSVLQLEITESAYMSSPDLMKDTIHRLRQAGFTILMDDFGSGFSSLNTLKEIEVDILKIDMKFLPVDQDVEKGEIILASMIKMANWLGMSVVVEGVETKAQRDFLEGAGCHYVQGYYYAKPMPQEEYEKNYVYSENYGTAVKAPEEQVSSNTTILVIDDVEMDRTIITNFLSDKYHVETCASSEEALVFLKRKGNKVRLILLDNIMPGMSGMDFLTYCKDSTVLRAIPKIMITAHDSNMDQVQAFQCGAYDYITKPLAKEVVLARVSHVMEISRHYRSFENLEYDYRDIAERDRFTGLLNKSAFFEIAGRYIENHPDESMALLVFDFDHFKQINDKYGHQQGDAVIKHAAEVLKKEFRKIDLSGRFGGDEFMVMMTNLSGQDIAKRKAEEISKHIAVTCAREDQISAGVSVGISFREAEDTLEMMFSRADSALYEAKETGRGKVVLYGEQVPPVADDDKPIIMICGEDPQLYPAVALSYGDSAAFVNITNFENLKETFAKYQDRICVICLDMQKQKMSDSDAFYQYILQQGGGSRIPLVAVCKEGDMGHLRSALELKIQDCITLPPQIDVIQRKLSRLIISGCAE